MDARPPEHFISLLLTRLVSNKQGEPKRKSASGIPEVTVGFRAQPEFDIPRLVRSVDGRERCRTCERFRKGRMPHMRKEVKALGSHAISERINKKFKVNFYASRTGRE